MAKRKSDPKAERIETLESLVVWLMQGHYENYLTNEFGRVTGCRFCGLASNRLYQSKAHDVDCPWRRGNELRKKLKPRKGETK